MLYRFLAILLVFALIGASPAQAAIDKKPLAELFHTTNAGRPLPAFVFKDGTGKDVRLADFKGRFILLNVWATWCAPCVKEMPALDQLQSQINKEKFLVLALALDREGTAKVPSFYQRHGIKNLDLFLDGTGQAMFTLKLKGLPTTILLDQDGKELGRVQGDLDWIKPENLQFLSQITGQEFGP